MTLTVKASSARAFHLAARRSRRSTWLPKRSVSTCPDYEECDITIVGGGPAGLALASALGSSQLVRESLRVSLIEAGNLSKVRQWSPPEGTFSNRAVSLTNASQAFLKAVGAWNHIEAERTCPVEDMQVWDGISDARIDFSTSDLGLDTFNQGMSRIIENLNIQRGLLRHLEGIPAIQILENTKVKSIENPQGESGQYPIVHLDNGRVLRTRLLVGADGFNSPVRAFAKIPSFGWAYDAQAIVATMSHPPRGTFQGPNTTAYQRFLPTGPIAFLPLSPTVSSLVWSTKPPLVAALTACGPAVLASMINAAFRLPDVSMRHLNNIILEAHATGTPLTHSQIKEEILWRERSHKIDHTSAYASASVDETTLENVGIPPAGSELLPPLVMSLQPGTVASFPLRFSHTESYVGEGEHSRTVLVGDAAHTVHPLAGQGMNLGLADVECLARCINNALLQGGDVGSHTALLPYTQERYFENHKVMSVMDKLHKLYSSTFEPVVWARSVGLEVLNEFDSVKAAIMMSAGAKSTSASGNEHNRQHAASWNLAAQGFEGLSAAVGAANMVRQGVEGMISTRIQSLLKAASGSQSSAEQRK